MAEREAAFDLSMPLKRGNLLKQGAFHKAFKHREFILYPGFLVYYDNEKCWRHDIAKGEELGGRTGAVKLKGATISVAKHPPKHCKYGLTIEAPDPDNKRSHYLINTNSREERDAWVDALRKATPLPSRNIVRTNTALKAALSLSSHLKKGDEDKDQETVEISAEEETNIDDLLGVMDDAYQISSSDESYLNNQPLNSNDEAHLKSKDASAFTGDESNHDRYAGWNQENHPQPVSDAALEPVAKVEIWVRGEDSKEKHREPKETERSDSRGTDEEKIVHTNSSTGKYRSSSSGINLMSSKLVAANTKHKTSSLPMVQKKRLQHKNNSKAKHSISPGVFEYMKGSCGEELLSQADVRSQSAGAGRWVHGDTESIPPEFLKKSRDLSADEDNESSDVEEEDDSEEEYVSVDELDLPLSLFHGQTSQVKGEPYVTLIPYKADDPGQISFEAGETLYVLNKLEDGWWFVSNGRDEGWAPCSYLEGDKDEETITNIEDIKEKYYSVDNYVAEEDDEISFQRGAVMEVLQKSVDGWWRVRINEQVGLAPATFLKMMEAVEVQSSPSSSLRRRPPPSPVQKVFQQPPRRATVRAKARQRTRHGGVDQNQPASDSGRDSQLSPAPHNHSPERLVSPRPVSPRPVSPRSASPRPVSPRPVSPRPVSPRSASPRPRQRTLASSRSMDESVSRDTSDSVPNGDSPDSQLHQQETKNVPHLVNNMGGASISTGTATPAAEKPVAKPRTRSSQGNLLLPQLSVGGESSYAQEDPPVPQRPSSYHLEPLDGSTQEAGLMDEPHRPANRPSNTEIRKAKLRARSFNRQGKDGQRFRSDERSASLTADLIRQGGHGRVSPAEKDNTKRRANSSEPLESQQLPQERKSKLQDQSPVGKREEQAAPSSGGQEADVANALLRYFMSSEDPALKAALRNIIQDSAAQSASLS